MFSSITELSILLSQMRVMLAPRKTDGRPASCNRLKQDRSKSPRHPRPWCHRSSAQVVSLLIVSCQQGNEFEFLSNIPPVHIAQTYGVNHCCCPGHFALPIHVYGRRRCVRSGNRCTFSKRRWHLPEPHREQPQPLGPGRDGAHGTDLIFQSSPPGPLATTGRIPLKR